MKKHFFNVTHLSRVFEFIPAFPVIGTERIELEDSLNRVLAEPVVSDIDLPGFSRATMDGYAVRASATFGASEGNPAYLNVIGAVAMGEVPGMSVGPGEVVRIATGGMLPEGTDSVIMVEHTEEIDPTTIEVYKSVAPGQHIIEKGEDFQAKETVLSPGKRLRAQEIGLLAAFGNQRVSVFRKPVISIISTGDEVVSIDTQPKPGQVRDINRYSLSGLIRNAGGIPLDAGLVKDDYALLLKAAHKALDTSDMVLVSGGSSMGMRDFTVDVFEALPESGILVHGISISPGKPTILAKAADKAVWGIPGHVVSAMVVFETVVKPFIYHIAGMPESHQRHRVSARLTRNIASAQGRVDFVRVKLIKDEKTYWAEPILGKSGLIRTMVKADGLVEVGLNTEGLDKGTQVNVIVLD